MKSVTLSCISISMLLTVAVPGCNDTPPPPMLYEDLGTEGKPLLPVSSPWHVTAIKDGTAEWHEFREPTPFDQKVEKVGDEAPTTLTDAEKAEIESEIRDVINEYNELAAKGNNEDLLDFFAPEQRDAARKMLETEDAARAKIAALKAVLDAQLPNDKPRITAILGGILSASKRMDVKEIKVLSDTKAEAAWGKQVIRFRVVDDYWVFEWEAWSIEAVTELAAPVVSGLDTAIQTAQSGPQAAQQILAGLEAQVAAFESLEKENTQPSEPKESDE